MTESLRERPRSCINVQEWVSCSCVGFIYFTPSDLLIPRVDRQCVMRFCEAVAGNDVQVEVVSLATRLRFNEPTRSRTLFDVYGITKPFRVITLPSRMNQLRREEPSRVWRSLIYGGYTAWELLLRRRAFKRDLTILYFKNYLIGLPLLVLKIILRHRLLLLFEMHGPPTRRVDRVLLRRLDGIVAETRALSQLLQTEVGIKEERIVQAHQGVNLDFVEQVRLTKREARERLGLPLEKELAIYTGKVHTWSREIELILDAAMQLDDSAELVIVGGREDHVEELRQRTQERGIRNARFVGFVAPADVFHYQMAADVLVTYYPSDVAATPYLSPGKLFEYMASKTPIVTADYPVLREILSPGAAIFVEKDRPEALARGILTVLHDERLAHQLAEQAYVDVQEFTWRRRAERVLDFAQRLHGHSRGQQLKRRRDSQMR